MEQHRKVEFMRKLSKTPFYPLREIANDFLLPLKNAGFKGSDDFNEIITYYTLVRDERAKKGWANGNDVFNDFYNIGVSEHLKRIEDIVFDEKYITDIALFLFLGMYLELPIIRMEFRKAKPQYKEIKLEVIYEVAKDVCSTQVFFSQVEFIEYALLLLYELEEEFLE